MRKRIGVPVFGAKGTKLIEFTGKLPGIFGPFVTRKVYRFHGGKNPRLVDVRDLTLLVKAAGRKNLRDVSEGREAEKKRLEGQKKPKRVREVKSKPVEVPVEQEQEEVGNDIE